MKEKILKLNDIKSTNLQAVLDVLLQTDGLSRVEIARRIGCDNTTVTRAVGALIEQGIVVQGEKTEQALGRPRVILRINPDGPLLLGLSLEAERITGVLTDLRGIPQEHMERVLSVDCPFMLFPYTRQIVSQITMDGGFMPVVAPVAEGPQGRALNVNADTAAGAVAGALAAEYFVLMSDVPGVLDKQGVLQPRLTRADIDAFKADGTITGGMIPKVDACLNALDHGCRRALILNGSESGALKRYLVDGEPLGTVVEN